MLQPICDRCRRAGQITQVLGVDLCGRCVDDARAWLRDPYVVPRTARGHIDRELQASNLLARCRTITSARVAAMSGEPRRRAYNSLMCLARKGRLRYLGQDTFALPQDETESCGEYAILPVRRKSA